MKEGEKLDEKTLGFLVYIIANMAMPTKTALIKMSYLCDYAAINSNKSKITSFNYIRYYYGPYDKRIEDFLLELAKSKIIKADTLYTVSGEEYERFSICADKEAVDEKINNLDDKDLAVVDSILKSLGDLSPRALTKIAYKTEPMVRLGATLGGNEHLGAKLKLQAK